MPGRCSQVRYRSKIRLKIMNRKAIRMVKLKRCRMVVSTRATRAMPFVRVSAGGRGARIEVALERFVKPVKVAAIHRRTAFLIDYQKLISSLSIEVVLVQTYYLYS